MIIEVEDLHKHFKVHKHHRGTLGAVHNLLSREFTTVRAVDGVSFQIAEGELIGYLGPNGAGKSTTIKMLTGILVPTSGRLVVDERVPWRQRAEHVLHIGVVFGQRTSLWWDLPVIESFDLLRHIYRIPPDRYRQNLSAFDDLLELGPFLNTPVRSLSLGQRMRADLAAAFLHDPKLVFLDEPTIGLDVVAKERIRSFIRGVNRERGTTVILTTHDLGDVEKLCQRVLMIDRGHIIFNGVLGELRERFGGQRVLVVDFAEDYADVRVGTADLIGRQNNRAFYRFDRSKISASELIGHIAARYRVRDLGIQEQEIEEIVRKVYEGDLLLSVKKISLKC